MIAPAGTEGPVREAAAVPSPTGDVAGSASPSTDPAAGRNPDVDDAVHILGDRYSSTLCGQTVRIGMTLARLYGPQPDPFSGCWECMRKRHEITGEGWKP